MEFYFLLICMRSYTDSDLSSTDNIVPFLNINYLDQSDQSAVFCPFILINRNGIFEHCQCQANLSQ